jgi:glycosyltransferase involved in cell wall biosynthesis
MRVKLDPTSRKRILFVVSYRFSPIGGHLLSAVSLANCLSEMGHIVGILVHPTNIPDVGPNVAIHPAHFKDGFRGRLERACDVMKIVRSFHYETLVTMDWLAVRHVSLAVVLLNMPIVQVHPGGPVLPIPPLRLPGIVLFSKELKEGLQEQHKVSADNLILSPGRIDFQQLQRQLSDCSQAKPLNFSEGSLRLLTISRLEGGKSEAIYKLMQAVADVAQQQKVQLRIIGEGEARSDLEDYATTVVENSNNMADIEFLGGFRVTPCDLAQADLVIGQGRTVLEAIACGVPGSVCGSDGYFGLITSKSVSSLMRTNFTGRFVRDKATLISDLQCLEKYKRNEFEGIKRQIQEIYDVQNGACAILRAVEMMLDQCSQWKLPRLNMLWIYIRYLVDSLRHYHTRFWRKLLKL